MVAQAYSVLRLLAPADELAHVLQPLLRWALGFTVEIPLILSVLNTDYHGGPVRGTSQDLGMKKGE